MTDISDEELSACDALKALEEEYDSDVYFYSGGIEDEGFEHLVERVAESTARKNGLLILATNGGSANAAYQIARFLQDHYEKWTLFCPGRCKSAGTLVAIGASALIMDIHSELGPLDVQLIKQNEIALRKSGLLSRSSFDALADAAFELYERLMISITFKSQGNVSFKMASELSATMTATALSPIYAQMSPDVIGSENRDLNVAIEYGVRLARHSRNAKAGSVERLVHLYPSHDFVIDMAEAKQLFKRVDYPSINLYRVIAEIGQFAYNEAPNLMVCALRELFEEESDDDEATKGKPIRDTAKSSVADSGEEDSAVHTVGTDRGAGNGETSDTEVGRAVSPSIPPKLRRIIQNDR